MSSFATAPSRTPDQESLAGKPQTQPPVNPAAPPSWEAKPQTENPQAQAPAVAANSSQTLEEVQRVEKLLAQLEARSMALVPYGYGNLRDVPLSAPVQLTVAGWCPCCRLAHHHDSRRRLYSLCRTFAFLD